jgi:sugar lactone lactonase YvrE
MKPPIAPVRWMPPPVTELAKPPTPLPKLRRISLPAEGEDVLVDRDGKLITGLADGRLLRLDPVSESFETLANTGGRPMCSELDPQGRLVICDAERGLLRLDLTLPSPRLEVLLDAKTYGIHLCNNVAVARDGTIYFSDSSQRFTLAYWRGDVFEQSGTGRLYRLATDGKLTLLRTGLYFANGVALASDESFVAVSESGAYRIARVWLTGEKQGQQDYLYEGLPGFPDNMASDENGLIWVAIASKRNSALDFLHRAPPLLRRIVWALPEAMQPVPDRLMRVMALDDQGRVVHDLAGRDPSFHMATGLRVAGNKLYLASIEEAALAELTLP